jgi:hypothetical protein
MLESAVNTGQQTGAEEAAMPEYTVVQCSQGHCFSTIWLPMVSVKSIRLGDRRVQKCPVCHRFRSVRQIAEDELAPEELEAARQLRDSRLP